jgi:hypothetical protein
VLEHIGDSSLVGVGTRGVRDGQDLGARAVHGHPASSGGEHLAVVGASVVGQFDGRSAAPTGVQTRRPQCVTMRDERRPDQAAARRCDVRGVRTSASAHDVHTSGGPQRQGTPSPPPPQVSRVRPALRVAGFRWLGAGEQPLARGTRPSGRPEAIRPPTCVEAYLGVALGRTRYSAADTRLNRSQTALSPHVAQAYLLPEVGGRSLIGSVWSGYEYPSGST